MKKWELSSNRVLHRLLIGVSLSVHVVSVFQPWLWEWSPGPLVISPFSRIVSRFWSFQTVISYFADGRHLTASDTFRFQEYWYRGYAQYPDLYQGWMWVFVFQMFVVALGALSIVRERVKGHQLPIISTVSTSAVSLILGYYQLLRQFHVGGLDTVLLVVFRFIPYVDIGFFLAHISVILWTVPLWIDKVLIRNDSGAQPSPEPKVKVMIPMYEPLQVSKCEKCGKIIAEPKELIIIMETEKG